MTLNYAGFGFKSLCLVGNHVTDTQRGDKLLEMRDDVMSNNSFGNSSKISFAHARKGTTVENCSLRVIPFEFLQNPLHRQKLVFGLSFKSGN